MNAVLHDGLATLRRRLVQGSLWGVAVVAMESFALPMSQVDAARVLSFLGMLAPKWVAVGVILACLTLIGLYGGLRAWHILLAWAACFIKLEDVAP